MILISCRGNFDDGVNFGPQLAHNGAANVPSWQAEIPASTILIHGYHSTAGAAEESYGVAEAAMPGSRMLGYLWPGGAIAIDYMLAVIRARTAGWRLRDALFTMPTGDEVDIQTHSLGARVALESLKYGGLDARHLILSAPAVDHDCFERGKEFAAAPAHCKSVNVFCSSNDPVLKTDYPLGSFGRQALGLYGPKSIEPWPVNLRVFDCSRVVHAHGGYRYAPEYFAAWRSILDGSAKPGLTVL